MREPLLSVRDLTVELRGRHETVLDKITFDVAAGETLGLLGESGAGKSTLARALLRLLDKRTCCETGSICFRGSELMKADERTMQTIRGAQIALISQEPELALNPLLPVGKQVDEVLRAHSKLDRNRRRAHIEEMLTAVELPDGRTHRSYPHELSGGQRQRFVIAQALIAQPALLIADEPTSALDNVTQAEILNLFRRLRDRFKLALILITHNPTLLHGLAERVLVMHQGRIVEEGPSEQIYWNPQHSYTKTLAKAIAPLPAGA